MKSLATAAVVLPLGTTLLPQVVRADDDEIPEEVPFREIYNDITEGKTVKNGAKVMKLNIPEQPSSGAAVPIEVTVDLPMEPDNYVAAIHVLTTKNKINHVVTANYTPANGMAYLYVNAKLGTKQDVVILAETSKGVVYEAKQYVRAPLGGCG